MAFDVAKMVTDRIIADLEKGTIPWRKTWVNTAGTAVARSHNDGRVYSLLNQLLLGLPGEYATFLQVQKEGGKVKKGAKSLPVVFYKSIVKDKEDKNGNPVLDEDGNPKKIVIPILRYSNVFHIDETEGLTPKYVINAEPISEEVRDEKIEETIESYLSRSGVHFRKITQNRAYYRPSEDEVVVPQMGQFENAAEYYAAVFHELAHSTGPRLGREFGSRKSSSEEAADAYSREELVAEISAAVLCNYFNIQTEALMKNTSAYVQGWLKALKDDTKLIIWAASRAEKAVNLILNRETGEKTTEEACV